MRRLMLMAAALAVALVALGGLASARPGDGLQRTTTVVDGVPLTLVRSGSGTDRPGAVVVHGFAGSARLMQPFADALARTGYVVVLPDLAGHGTSTRPMTDPLPDVDTAVRYLRSQPDVDPDRTVLVGHSRGASAVVDYASTHRDIAATVAISLGLAPAALPHNLLVLYGQLEFPVFAAAALEVLERPDPTATVTTGHTYGSVADGTARRADPISGVEHISILYSDTAHRAMLEWLDATVHPGAPQGRVSPLARLWPAGLVLLGLLVGFVPLARLVLPPSTATSTPASPVRALVAVGAGLVAGLVTGLVARDPVLRLAVGGYTAVVLLVFAAVALLVLGPRRPRWPGRSGWAVTLRAVLLAVYAGAMVAVPIQLGFTSVEPSLPRLLPLLLVGVSTWLLFAAAERVSGGRWYLHAAILVAGVFLLLVLTFTGFGPGFLLLVVPLLVALLAIGAGVAAVLRRRAVPPWLIALVAAPVLAWTVATTLPIS